MFGEPAALRDREKEKRMKQKDSRKRKKGIQTGGGKVERKKKGTT